MMAIMSIPWIAIFCLVALAASPAHGQAAAAGEAHLGPIRCYVEITERFHLEHLKAKGLCMGAADEAPARCFAEATARVPGMIDLDAVQLCRAARSPRPLLAPSASTTPALSERPRS